MMKDSNEMKTNIQKSDDIKNIYYNNVMQFPWCFPDKT